MSSPIVRLIVIALLLAAPVAAEAAQSAASMEPLTLVELVLKDGSRLFGTEQPGPVLQHELDQGERLHARG